MFDDETAYEPQFWRTLKATVKLTPECDTSPSTTRIVKQRTTMDSFMFDLSCERRSGVYKARLDYVTRRRDPHWSIKFNCHYNAIIEGQQKNGTEIIEMNSKQRCHTVRFESNEANPTAAELSISIDLLDVTAIHPRMRMDLTNKTPLSDATLLVAGKRLYVTKSILAMQSAFFKRMFDEESDGEYTLTDVKFNDMYSLLILLYPHFSIDRVSTLFKDDNEMNALMDLARRYECPSVISIMENHLRKKALPVQDRLKLSDKHGLSHLASDGLKELHSRSSYKNSLKDATDNMSDELGSHLLEQVIDKMSRSRKQRVQHTSSCPYSRIGSSVFHQPSHNRSLSTNNPRLPPPPQFPLVPPLLYPYPVQRHNPYSLGLVSAAGPSNMAALSSTSAVVGTSSNTLSRVIKREDSSDSSDSE